MQRYNISRDGEFMPAENGHAYFASDVDARIAELERDAARYRWLRSAQPYVTPGCDNGDLITTLSGEDLDAGIDAALSLGKSGSDSNG